MKLGALLPFAVLEAWLPSMRSSYSLSMDPIDEDFWHPRVGPARAHIASEEAQELLFIFFRKVNRSQERFLFTNRIPQLSHAPVLRFQVA